MFAYLDSTGLVVGTSKKERTLQEAQLKNNQITGVIKDAPGEVCAVGHGLVTYKKTSGDGTLLEHYSTGEFLDKIKTQRKAEIDEKTTSLIVSPFTFDGVQFSMSLEAQANWTQFTLLNQMGLIAWPYNLSTYEDGEYSMTGEKFPSFLSAMVSHKTTSIDTGRALVLSIDSASSKVAIDAIVDAR